MFIFYPTENHRVKFTQPFTVMSAFTRSFPALGMQENPIWINGQLWRMQSNKLPVNANWKSIFYCPINGRFGEKIHYNFHSVKIDFLFMVGSIISWAQVFHPCRSSNFVWVVDEWIQKFFLSAKDRNCLASIRDANGDCGIQEAAGLKKDTSSFIPFWPWSLGPMDEVGGSIVVVVLNSSRRPSEKSW